MLNQNNLLQWIGSEPIYNVELLMCGQTEEIKFLFKVGDQRHVISLSLHQFLEALKESEKVRSINQDMN